MAIDIAKLKPTSENSEDIQTALDQIAATRGETEKDLIRARTQREHLMLEGSLKELRGAEQKIADLTLDLERIDLLQGKVEPTLQQAQERERAAAHAAAAEDLEAEIAASNMRWDNDLAAHVEAVTAMMTERRELAQRARILGLHHHAIDLTRGSEGVVLPTNEQMRHEQTEAAHLAQIEANEREYERRMAARREWQEQSRQIDERRRAAEADAERRGLRELPSPVRIVNG